MKYKNLISIGEKPDLQNPEYPASFQGFLPFSKDRIQ